MKILLIQPPLEDFYTTPIRLYPLGLLYVARTLKDFGCEVNILDCLTPLKKRQLPIPNHFGYLKPYLNTNPLLFQHYYRFGIDASAVISSIEDYRPDLIGIATQFTAYFQSVVETTELIKARFDIPVFVGGNHATVFTKEISEKYPAIDEVLVGPAEKSLPGFLARYQKLPAPAPKVIDWKTVQPSHDLIKEGLYRIGRKNYISLTASRGCPYGCDFCSVKAMFGRRIEYRSVESVLAEMRWNYRYKSVRIFNFEDDNLAVDRDWFVHLLTEIETDPLLADIELTAMNGMGYTHLDESILQRMYSAGFRQLNLSYVTHDNHLRQRYNRPQDDRHLERVVAAAQRLGYFTTVYLIIGLPEQSYTEIKSSIDYLLRLGVLVGPSVFYIPPGSALYDRLLLPSAIRDNWNLYRSSAFVMETKNLSRSDLIELFSYARRRNLKNRTQSKH